MSKALALKYRPIHWQDVVEQQSIKTILQNQMDTNTIKHGYLFTGPAGCGKTTSARIFANEINKHTGTPIELDAASNNSVEDIRRLVEQAQTKPLEGEYKVFVIDECHMLSNSAWNAFLKTLEEPPVTAIFIMCTTNPEKVPATILSRAQRYNFQKISFEGIVDRLKSIIHMETQIEGLNIYWDLSAIQLIAKIADGGMRDAITLMDKCLSYSKDLTEENVVKALGITDYTTMFRLTDCIIKSDEGEIINVLNDVYNQGLDLKQFIKDYFEFTLDVVVYYLVHSFNTIKIPTMYENELNYAESEFKIILELLGNLSTMQSAIKYAQNPKSVILANLLLFVEDYK